MGLKNGMGHQTGMSRVRMPSGTMSPPSANIEAGMYFLEDVDSQTGHEKQNENRRNFYNYQTEQRQHQLFRVQ